MSDKCLMHTDHEHRISKLEVAIQEIITELKAKAITDAKIEKSLDIMNSMLLAMQTSTDELRNNMIKLVAETLEKTRNDLTNILKIGETNEESERKWRRQMEESESEWKRKMEESDRRFYKKLILGCFSVGATIVLSLLGIKAIFPGIF